MSVAGLSTRSGPTRTTTSSTSLGAGRRTGRAVASLNSCCYNHLLHRQRKKRYRVDFIKASSPGKTCVYSVLLIANICMDWSGGMKIRSCNILYIIIFFLVTFSKFKFSVFSYPSRTKYKKEIFSSFKRGFSYEQYYRKRRKRRRMMVMCPRNVQFVKYLDFDQFLFYEYYLSLKSY